MNPSEKQTFKNYGTIFDLFHCMRLVRMHSRSDHDSRQECTMEIAIRQRYKRLCMFSEIMIQLLYKVFM